MTRIVVNGVGLNVEVRGSGPPLLLLHGFTGSARSWDGQAEAFSPEYTTIAPDVVGHGLSDAPPESGRYRMEHAADDLAAVLDALGVERAAVLGYSMGGRLALHLAVQHPDRVAALLLEGASPGIADSFEREARRLADEALAQSIERDGVEAFVARWEALPIFETQHSLPEEVRRRQREQRLANRPLGLANSLRGMGVGAQDSLWGRLAEIHAPTLIVTGELDGKYTCIGREMARRLPNAWHSVIPGAGHAAHLERPELFDQVVLRFLREHAGSIWGSRASYAPLQR